MSQCKHIYKEIDRKKGIMHLGEDITLKCSACNKILKHAEFNDDYDDTFTKEKEKLDCLVEKILKEKRNTDNKAQNIREEELREYREELREELKRKLRLFLNWLSHFIISIFILCIGVPFILGTKYLMNGNAIVGAVLIWISFVSVWFMLKNNN